MIRGAADDAVGVRGADDGHVGCGTAVEADGEEVGFVICVVDGVGATSVVDTEGAERSLGHGKLNSRLAPLHRLRSCCIGQAVYSKSSRYLFMHRGKGL